MHLPHHYRSWASLCMAIGHLSPFILSACSNFFPNSIRLTIIMRLFKHLDTNSSLELCIKNIFSQSIACLVIFVKV